MKKNYTILTLGISIFLSLMVVLVFAFFFKVIKIKNENTSKTLITLANKTADKKNADILVKKFSELRETKDRIASYFVDPSHIDIFVDYLENLGIKNDSELIVKNVEVSEKEKESILFKISVTGDFSNVMKIVHLLENIPYQVNLTQVFLNKEIKTEEVEIRGEKKQTERYIWRADVSFNILSLPQK